MRTRKQKQELRQPQTAQRRKKKKKKKKRAPQEMPPARRTCLGAASCAQVARARHCPYDRAREHPLMRAVCGWREHLPTVQSSGLGWWQSPQRTRKRRLKQSRTGDSHRLMRRGAGACASLDSFT
jgi:hypothetical protein